MDAPGVFEQVQVGRPLPAALADGARREALGFSVEQTRQRFDTGEWRREVVRAIVDREGRVVARHALRTWRRSEMLGGRHERQRFTLEVQLGDRVGATTQPASTQPVDEELLAMARSMALGQASRAELPQVWEDVQRRLLRHLNERRKRRGLPAAAKLAEGPAGLMAVAEMLLEAIDADDAEAMDRTVWGEMDFAKALRDVPRRLPKPKATCRWAGGRYRQDKGFSLTLGKLPVIQLAEDRYESGGRLANLGRGRVQLVLHSAWHHGAASPDE